MSRTKTIFGVIAGHEMVIIKGGQRVCGSGCALGNAPLVQNKSYFEVKLQQGGVWAVGVATRETDLNRVHGNVLIHLTFLICYYYILIIKLKILFI